MFVSNRPRLAVAVLSAALLASAATPALARSLGDEVVDVVRAKKGDEYSKSSTFSLRGYDFRVTSDYTFHDLARKRSGTVMANGHALYVATSADSFDNTTERDTIEVMVDGERIYYGRVSEFTEDHGLQLVRRTGAMRSQEVVTTDTQRTATQTLVGLISSRISQVVAPRPAPLRARAPQSSQVEFSDGIMGVSGGNGAANYGAWGTASYTWLDNDEFMTSYDGHLFNGVVGGDLRLRDNLVVGMALSGEKTGLETFFNSGTDDTIGFQLTPYAAISFLNNSLVLDGMAGIAWLDRQTESNNGTTAQVRADFEGYRYMAATNVTYYHVSDIYTVSAKSGLLFAADSYDSYTDTAGTRHGAQTSYLGEWRIGARASALMFGMFEPYLGASYVWDFYMSPTTSTGDRTEVEGVLGANMYFSDSITAGVEVSRTFDRAKLDATTALANLRVEF